MIRRAALSRHKKDFRDAETILDLLMREQFPAITPRSEKSREVLDPLEKSSGEKKRIGSISKHGSRLVRHLLLRDGIGYEEFTRRGEVGVYEGSGEVDKRDPIRSLND